MRDTRFWTFLEYINLAINRMLLDFDSIIKIYTKGLFNKGKERLRYILATALLDIYLIYDIWTLLNHLRLLAIIGHFISEKGELYAVILVLKELEGKYSGEN